MFKVWWQSKENNFGDILNPHIFNYFQIDYEFSHLEKADTLCIGSVVRRARENFNVFGSGIMFTKDKPHPKAKYHFVRGPRTRKNIILNGGQCPPIYGDPALLLPLFCNESEKEYDLGIVPHFVDYNFVKETYPNYHVIDLLNKDPLEVAKQITKCRHIISSSLHGIIAAHAYGIPAAWVKFSNNVKGDDIKFYDYFEGVNSSPILSTLESPKYQTVSYDINNIINAFTVLNKET